MSTLSLGLGDGDGVWQVALATSICVALGFFIYFVYAVTFSLPRAMSGYARVRKWVDGAVAGLFAIAGVGLLRSAFSK
ncbi:hypothetical protein [Pseudophaeobacter sp.]|uniref:hypothetical protein n=1 Tax=Pseudophaeobacter sp. TaxID=1971739 RepID=UPI00329947CD